MKTRKSLALVLALVMMLTLIPASAFAASTNTVANVPTVAADSQFTATMSLKLNDGSSIDGSVQKLGITLTNAEFAKYSSGDFVSAGAMSSTTTTSAIGIDNNTGGPIASMSTITKEKAAAMISFSSGGGIASGKYITITMNLIAGKDAGEVKVAIDGRDTVFTSGTYTVATVAGGATVAKVVGTVPTIGDRGTASTAAIQIDEIALGALASNNQKFKLVLPKGYEFTNGCKASGDLTTGAILNPNPSGNDRRELEVSFKASNTTTSRRTLSITSEITATSDAKAGDVVVRLLPVTNSGDGYVTAATDLVIAKYVEEGVTVTTVAEKDIPEIVAGREAKDSATSYVVKVTLKEAAPKSLNIDRYVAFTFNKEVQIATGGSLNGNVEYTVDKGAKQTIASVADKTTDNYEFEWKVSNADTSKAHEITFSIPVTVAADYHGDVTLTVSGAKAGVTETKLVVAKAVAPVTAELVIKDVRAGVQKQAVGDIVIKENFAGALRADSAAPAKNKVEIELDANNQGFQLDSGKIYLTKGDLELKDKDGSDVSITAGAASFIVKNYSVKTPGEVTIKDVKVTLNRTPAEGKYKLNVYGSSLVDNNSYKNNKLGSNSVSADYINVATPADQGVNSSFVIGNKTYSVNGVTKEMDAAPYIDAASRTMVPIRYIGYALGLTDSQVLWNPATSTATLFGKSTVVITVGKDTLSVNGAIVPMDTVAVNKDGRIYVPARYIGTALGAQVEWDQAKNTVAIYTVK